MNLADVVRAIRGREAGMVFFVVGQSDDCLLLADGRHRRQEKPKRKKPKHVELLAQSDSAAAQKLADGEKVTNNELWVALAEYRED